MKRCEILRAALTISKIGSTMLDRLFAGDVVSFTATFSSPSWDRPQVSSSTLRFLGKDKLGNFLDGRGLVIEEQFGDWDRSSLTSTSPEIITVARRG